MQLRTMRWMVLGGALALAGTAWATDAAAPAGGGTSDPAGTNQSSSGVDPYRPHPPATAPGGTPSVPGTGTDDNSMQRYDGTSGGSNSGLGTTPDSGSGEDESEMGGSDAESHGGGTAPGATTPAPAPR